MRFQSAILILVLAGGGLACDEDDDRRRRRDRDDDPLPMAPTAPAPVVPPPVVTPLPTPERIEFRAIGTLPAVLIRHSNTIDGLTQLVTDLPYLAAFTTTRDYLFLSLDASGFGVGFLQIQILVNGQVIREASSAGFYADPRLSLSVTYRRGQVLEATE